IEELISRGKMVYVVDMSQQPDKAAFRSVSEIPNDAELAVIGLIKNKSR
ncbi:MAG: CoA-binding protein, partial [Euryarchaeota archaeon]|nr:CoA-binding protein [Euryarchaeota archaeon]